MLQFFRDKSQSIFIQGIVLIIALVFVFWGVGANMMGSREAAIVVNDEEISFQKYQRTYDQLLSVYRQQFGGSVPEELLNSLGLSEQVKNQLIREAFLRQGSTAMGVFVSAPEIQQDIKNTEAFQNNGSFDMKKYKELLKANRLTPNKYEASRRVELLASKGLQSIGSFATVVTDSEINELFQQTKEKISLQFAQISPEKFVDSVAINEEELTSWFEKNKDNYKTSPRVKLKFLFFPYVGDSAPKDIDEEQARPLVFQNANAAYEGIISAGSLQEYAKQHPEVPVFVTELFSRDTPPDSLDNAPVVLNNAFMLKTGELSSLIESPNGYSILFAQETQAPILPALESVRDRVVIDYKTAQSQILAKEKGKEILSALKDKNKLNEISIEHNIEVNQTTLSRTSLPAPDNTFPPSLLTEAFSLSSTKPLPEEPSLVGNDFYIFQLNDRILPDPAEITEEETEEYRKQILTAKQERLLQAWIRHQEKISDVSISRDL